MKRIALHWQILGAMVLGVVFALVASDAVPSTDWLATAFLRLLKMIIVPLVFTSIIHGVAGQSSSGGLGRLGLKTLLYYITTSLLAIVTGLVLVNIVQPGVDTPLNLEEAPENIETIESLSDIVVTMIPENVPQAMAQGKMLPTIFFALMLGIVILNLPETPRKTLGGFFEAAFDAMMKMTHWIMLTAPIGVFAIVARVVHKQVGDPSDPEAMSRLSELATTMGGYMATVAGGLLLHAFVTLPLVLFLVARVNPWKQFGAMSTALMTVFSTASSSATLPITMDCTERKVGVSNRVTSFVLPLGATVNMDGTALYECVAAIFIAQAYGMHLSFTQQVTVVFTALLASIGAAGVPMAGLVTITIILRALGLPLEAVGLILAVDRILDMMRSTVNVWSDATGAVTLARTEGESGFHTE